MLVTDQGAVLNTIEENIQHTEITLEGGNQQVDNAIDDAKSARKKKWICFFLTIIILAIIIIIVLKVVSAHIGFIDIASGSYAVQILTAIRVIFVLDECDLRIDSLERSGWTDTTWNKGRGL